MKLFGTQIDIHWSIVVPFAITCSSLEYSLFLVLVYMMVLAHEYGHIFACRLFGNDCKKIVLSAIGGMALLDRGSKTPMEEFAVALSGPMVNVAMILACIASFYSVPHYILELVVIVNTIMVVFNLIPAFPMDGGRVLRAILWWILGVKWANRVCFAVTVIISMAGIAYGFYIANYWLAFIALVVGVLGALSFGESEDEQENIQSTMDSRTGAGRTAQEQNNELLCSDSPTIRNNSNI